MLGWWTVHVEVHVADSTTTGGRNAPKSIAVWLRTNPAVAKLAALRQGQDAATPPRIDNEVSLDAYRDSPNGLTGTSRSRR